MKLLHLINPVKVAKNHELYTAQPITFSSMIKAKNTAIISDYEVVLATTQFEEDKEIIPRDFVQLSNLSKSVNDVNSILQKRKLPLIKDILQKSKEVENVDYIIYTNVDIGLMPFFYESVFKYINEGHDAIVINKRRLSSNYTDLKQLNDIYTDLGKSHPGFDCFIFKTELLDKFILDDICVGVPFIGVSLLHNLVAYAEKPKIVLDRHLTFHIGMSILDFERDVYYKHNRNVFFQKIQPAIKNHFELKKFPYGEDSILKSSIKWVLNPSIFTTNYIKLLIKDRIKKLKFSELRWQLLQR